MGRKFGIFCLLLGIGCLLSSVVFLIYNHWEENRAENVSQYLLQDIQEKIMDASREAGSDEVSYVEDIARDEASGIENPAMDVPQEMPMTQVEGYDCIGVLSIPVLELELPVLTDWSYAKLKIAPCHYYGTYYERDFVIAAHNYQSHFGRLSQLQPEDLVLFTDITGTTYCYEVVLLETLPGNATEEMITSGFDLSLYTCTPGGSGRVTVRCNAVQNRGEQY